MADTSHAKVMDDMDDGASWPLETNAPSILLKVRWWSVKAQRNGCGAEALRRSQAERKDAESQWDPAREIAAVNTTD